MTRDMGDYFLGRWAVTESIYSGAGSFLGQVKQQRSLSRQEEAESLTVTQICTPGPELAEHPMHAFSGEFTFTLRKEGRQRRYLGPDVHGHGMSFGDIFLLGQGVWPRFGYSFRSWSISLSDTLQLTGGCFFRGLQLDAVIVGVGVSGGVGGVEAPTTGADAAGFAPGLPLQSAEGTAVLYNYSNELESTTSVTRQLLNPLHWVEYGDAREDSFRLEARGNGYLLRKNRRTIGTAKAYGPVLAWEIHGEQGESTTALDISAPGGKRWFSLRQHFLSGRLTTSEGLRFNT